MTTLERIAERYHVTYMTVARQWAEEETFPPILDHGSRAYVYDEAVVDEWVRECRPEVWIAAHPNETDKVSLPSGNPKDLLRLEEIGELEGRFLSRDATPVTTLRTYMSPSKGILAPPDRRPDDGKKPVVVHDMWFRETAYAYITRPRRVRRNVAEAASEPREPSEFLRRYFEEHPGLLNLERIAQLDGLEHNRAPTSMNTLKTHRKQKKLAPPDRRPRDGLEPPVEELMWEPATVLPYLCRPDGRRFGTANRTDDGA
ncbi:hypothetical protein [Streptomyces sp. YIM 121038]|uniref:hypothetical protein n=1 Tax=Streptomyces sp. YIM 121038 TaxID=2136401 RepID=UPI001110AE7C|nr:hypothetical protein [Streptomyces sp. YIM 121038]